MALPRCRPVLVAAVLAAGLFVPVATAPTASAAPCTVVLGIPLCLLPPAATTGPVIQGEAKIGETIRTTEPVWDQAGVRTTYQWLRNGDDIAGATTPTYELTGDDFGTQVSVRTTGTGGALLPGTAVSAFVEPDKGDAPKATTKPAVSPAAARVGTTLTTTDGVWPGEPAPTYTYQWFRSRFSGKGAEKIPGATAKTYRVVAADSGRAVVAVVTADRIGYEKGAAVSDPVRVAKTTSTVRLALVKSTVKRTQAPSVRVVVASSIGLVPRGVVTIFDGTRRVRSFTLAAAARGTATVRLPRQGVGRHRLIARYQGDTAHQPSTSGIALLTVKR